MMKPDEDSASMTRLRAFQLLRYLKFLNLFISDSSFNSINSELLCGAQLTLACMTDEIRAAETFKMRISTFWLFSIVLFSFPICSNSHWW